MTHKTMPGHDWSSPADATNRGRCLGVCMEPLKPYLDPEGPTFLGFLIMISFYMSLNRKVLQGPGKP